MIALQRRHPHLVGKNENIYCQCEARTGAGAGAAAGRSQVSNIWRKNSNRTAAIVIQFFVSSLFMNDEFQKTIPKTEFFSRIISKIVK